MSQARDSGAGRAPARAALAGNPSDGWGGAVLAVTLANWAAEVELAPAARASIEPPSELIAATLRRCAGVEDPLRVRWRSDVPLEVGLAGSSAIVIATLRALDDLRGRVRGPDHLAAEALAVEVEDLGIAAGPQDRVVQAHGGLLLMDFAAGLHTHLDPGLMPPLLIAHHAAAAAPSGGVHAGLRARHRRGEPAVLAAMQTLAGLAREAALALQRHDPAGFGRCVAGSLRARTGLVDLHPEALAAASLASEHEVPTNYAGSGGALVLLPPDPERSDAVTAALAERGWQVQAALTQPAADRPARSAARARR
jgi:glucuronokinase